ncbi:hypothetical protein C8R43DRAFT_985149 [Mycena crocata]|nr:hypothetical protein C8R43DRAFT_985149 [Mycena crocata]
MASVLEATPRCDVCSKTQIEIPSETMQTPCSGCRARIYCGKLCQKSDWQSHKKHCSEMGKYRKMKKETGRVGLVNEGCKDYLDVFLQLMHSLPCMRSVIDKIPTQSEDPAFDPIAALQDIFRQLDTSDQPVLTTQLEAALDKAKLRFDGNKTDSPHDFSSSLREFFALLEDRAAGTVVDGAIKNLVVGRLQVTVRSQSGPRELGPLEEFNDLDAKTPWSSNLLEGLRKFTASSNVQNAGARGTIEHNLNILSLPPILFVSTSRVKLGRKSVMTDRRFEFPFEVDLAEFLPESEQLQDYEYKLHAIVLFDGDLTGGCFTLLAKSSPSGDWLRFEDEEVKPATLHEVGEENYGGRPNRPRPKRFPFMLVYVREAHREKIFSDYVPETGFFSCSIQ